MSTSSSGPRRVPRPRAAPKSPSSAAAANRGLRLRTPVESDSFPSTGSHEDVLRELRLSSPGHQRAPEGLGESRDAGRLPSVQALRKPVNAGPLAQVWWILLWEDTGGFPMKSPEASERPALPAGRGPDPPPHCGIPAAPVQHCGLRGQA
ncbi:unnamed protein product [Rangifer tarandus platyrhynchus]|uniref:Uncharacterized protein n=2 Tax=Rangifer tarandus platyrhynchus TaxID=3082113 RepID=A0ACB0EQ22_RANTA|nr:unnamed protein product [Rangifer tarandus platyrhynchus]CAI9702166.1 unnamed protein product [Rangifer tarandus platyrhynchus]